MTTDNGSNADTIRTGELVVDHILSGDGEFLSHYGVKGMKWGIRNEDDSGGGSSGSSNGDYQKAHKPKAEPSPHEAAKNLAKQEEKSQAKFGEPKTPGFVSKHKKALLLGASAALVIGLTMRSGVAHQKLLAEIQAGAGKGITPSNFTRNVKLSKYNTWARNDYFHPSSFDRPEFSLPAGHTFHRISRQSETTFQRATYSTHNINDFNRYVVGFRNELGTGQLHHITYQAAEEIRVPNLRTVLDTLKETMPEGAQDHHVLELYQELSGGSWSSPKAERLLDALEAKGYGALVDEMDAGVIGDSPIVMFARNGVGPKSAIPLTPEAIANAEANLIELTNRKL